MRRVLVIGAGFGGLNAALVLQEALAPRRKVELTLVTDQTHFLFTPLLPNAATGDIEPSSISVPLEDLLDDKTSLVLDRIHTIDFETRQAHGQGSYAFDYLILAPGSVVRWDTGHETWQDRHDVFTLKGARDAVSIRDRISRAFREAIEIPDREERRKLLTFVVAGAGPTGVSLAAELKSCIEDDFLADYPMLAPLVSVIVIEERASVLPGLEPGLRRVTLQVLKREGFDLRLGERVADFTDGVVSLESGDTIETNQLFWCGGVCSHPLLDSTSLPRIPDGRVRVDANLKVDDDTLEGVYVIGDAACPPEETSWSADIATQQGRVAAANIIADLSGRARQRFSYEDPGDIISLGRRQAAGTYRGKAFEGKAARALYRVIYTALIPSAVRKMLVLRDWVATDMRSRPHEVTEYLPE